jgi:Rieske Fe-S protein
MVDAEASRRGFLQRLAAALGAFLAVAAGVPIVGALIAPALHGEEAQWVPLGQAGDFVVGQPRLVSFGLTKMDGYQRTTLQRGVWVYRPNAAEIVVYSARCTHLGCLINFQADSGTFFCPCHGGVFALADGRVLEGPPPRPVDRLAHRIEDGRLLIQYRDFVVGVPEQDPL